MASRTQNITIDMGSDYIANVVAYSNGSTTTALNLTGYTANAFIKRSFYSNSDSIFVNTFIVDQTSGIINLHVGGANTAAMSPGNYVYDVAVSETSTSYVTRVVEGIVTLKPRVSHF